MDYQDLRQEMAPANLTKVRRGRYAEIDIVRKCRRRGDRTLILQLLDVAIPHVTDHAESVIASVDTARLLNALSGRQREIITMRFLQGYGWSDIAGRFSITKGTVDAHCFQAIKKMRKYAQIS